MVKTPCLPMQRASKSDQGTKIPHATWCGKKKKHSFSCYELEIVYFLVGLVINTLGIQVLMDLNFAIIILKAVKVYFF